MGIQDGDSGRNLAPTEEYGDGGYFINALQGPVLVSRSIKNTKLSLKMRKIVRQHFE